MARVFRLWLRWQLLRMRRVEGRERVKLIEGDGYEVPRRGDWLGVMGSVRVLATKGLGGGCILLRPGAPA